MTGKNKGDASLPYNHHSGYSLDNLVEGMTYTVSCEGTKRPFKVSTYDNANINSDEVLSEVIGTKLTFIYNKKYDYKLFVWKNSNWDLCNGQILNIQLEEGTEATEYEPYKEHIKTYYLNSPLLEGDTIEDNGNNVVHVHRYGTMLIDGSGNWTQNTVWSTDDYLLFFDTTKPKYQNSTVMSDKLPSYSDIIQNSTPVKEGFRNEVANFQISIASSKLSTKDLKGFI